EIDALLDGLQFPVFNEWLVTRLELSAQDIGTLFVQVGSVLASDIPQDEADEQLVEVLVGRARTAEKKFTKEQVGALYPEARELVAGLRSALAEQVANVAEEGAPQAPHIHTYDFKHPARVNRTQMRALENLHDNFARLLSSTFSGAMRQVVDVDTAFIDQTTYAEFIMSLSNPACSYQFTLGPTNGQVVLDVAMPIVFAAVDRIFGGKGASEGVQARQITPIEMGVINRIAKRMIEDLEATWEPVFPVEISDVELETNPEFMQITAANEIVVLLAFEVNTSNASGLVSLCYPFFTLESILPRLGQASYVQMDVDREKVQRDNRLRLGGMSLDVRGELGSTQISLGQARALKVGDVVALDSGPDDLQTLRVGSDVKFLGKACASHRGRHAIKVAGPASK
ncbi:MAG: flagellar motor switch protein FliM, partial [Candidatus Latescibacterota bacterium]|nr:flagellar motor switch protein FliM [Candidatus Latescibacterota bacterium]